MSEIHDSDLKFRQTFRTFMHQNLHDFEWHELKRMMEQEIELLDLEKYRQEQAAPTPQTIKQEEK